MVYITIVKILATRFGEEKHQKQPVRALPRPFCQNFYPIFSVKMFYICNIYRITVIKKNPTLEKHHESPNHVLTLPFL